MNDNDEPRPPTPEQIAELLAKRKPRPWEKVRSTGLFHWHSTVKIREYWEPFYQHLAGSLDSYFLENPLSDLLLTVMRDGTAGRRNAAFEEFLGAFDSNGRYDHAGSTTEKALPRVRKLLGEQYLQGVASSGASRTRLYRWALSALRMGDSIGSYPSDHDVHFKFVGPGDVAGMADRAAEAMFAMFARTLCEFPPIAGYVTMAGKNAANSRGFEHDNGYVNTPADCDPFTAGYHWGLFVPNPDVEILGGHDRFTRDAPVDEIVDVEPTDGSPTPAWPCG